MENDNIDVKPSRENNGLIEGDNRGGPNSEYEYFPSNITIYWVDGESEKFEAHEIEDNGDVAAFFRIEGARARGGLGSGEQVIPDRELIKSVPLRYVRKIYIEPLEKETVEVYS